MDKKRKEPSVTNGFDEKIGIFVIESLDPINSRETDLARKTHGFGNFLVYVGVYDD